MSTALLGIVELLGIGHCCKSRSPIGVGLRIRTQLPFLLAFFVVGDELNSSEKMPAIKMELQRLILMLQYLMRLNHPLSL